MPSSVITSPALELLLDALNQRHAPTHEPVQKALPDVLNQPVLQALIEAAGLEIDFAPLAGRVSITPAETCRVLHIGTTRLYRLLNLGALQSYREGKGRRIVAASIKTYVLRQLVEAARYQSLGEAAAASAPAPVGAIASDVPAAPEPQPGPKPPLPAPKPRPKPEPREKPPRQRRPAPAATDLSPAS
jgi:hypothetical protein